MGILAALDAAAAEDALAGIADDGWSDIVKLCLGLCAHKHFLAYAGLLCHVEQLALAVFGAGLAVDGVVAQKQLNADAAGGKSLGGVDENFHTLVYGVNAGGYKTSCALHLNKAYAAGALTAFAVIECAERGNFITALAGSFQYSEACLYLIVFSFDFDIDFTHCGSLLYSLMMASNLQLAMHIPHLMHFAGSMVNTVLPGVPVIASTGQTREQREHFLHFSATML